jgi:DNA polymerase-3 subunit beta
MKLTCDRQELSEAFALATQVVGSRTTRPVLQNLCVIVQGGELEVVATDLETGVRIRCERYDAEGEGKLLLKASHANDILREVTEDKVTIELLDDVATIRAGDDEFQLITENPEDFPEVPGFAAEQEVKLERTLLETMLRKTSFAAASEGHRYALNGVLFEIDGDTLRLVATDGKRLALAERGIENASNVAVKRVVSNKAVQMLTRLSAPEDETISLAFTENQIMARSSRAVMVAQLVQGHFPPYQEVIPKGLDKRIEFETQPFLAALRRASLLTTKDSFAVRFAFTYHKLTLTSRIPGLGGGTIELPVAYEGDPIETAFNPTYLRDVLKVLDQPRFVFEMKEKTLPSILREGEGFLYIVMPIELT